MYDYMKALEDSFAPTPRRGKQQQELEVKRQAEGQEKAIFVYKNDGAG